MALQSFDTLFQKEFAARANERAANVAQQLATAPDWATVRHLQGQLVAFRELAAMMDEAVEAAKQENR